MNLNLNQYQAFIFDLDATLIDSGKYHADGFSRAVEALGQYLITEEERCEFLEQRCLEFTPVLAARHGLELDPLKVLELEQDYVQAHFSPELFPGARTFVHKWKKRKPMALVSGCSKAFVKRVLIDARLIDVFELVITADDMVPGSPGSELIRETLSGMGRAPDEVLVVEDGPSGAVDAQRAGCPVVIVEDGNGRAVDGVQNVTWRELFKG